MKRLLFVVVAAFAIVTSSRAQSTNQDFPTPVNQTEISGAIVARDIGDARLTRHFYTFFADNGDVDLKIETANFDGDIDLFEANTLRPLLKVTVYGNSAADTTARTVYFRKRAQVVLRVEGRTLIDRAASYRISFGGSFAAAGLPEPPVDSIPQVADKTSPNAIARVNSAGAIIEVLPQPKVAETVVAEAPPKPPASAESAAEAAPKPRTARRNTRRQQRADSSTTASNSGNSNQIDSRARAAKTNSRTSQNSNAENRATDSTPNNAEAAPTNSAETAANSNQTTTARRNRNQRRAANPDRRNNRNSETNAATAESPLDPLANLRLIVLLKNSERVERAMTEVFRVTVDKGDLTVITKSGKIERYKLVDVARFAIE